MKKFIAISAALALAAGSAFAVDVTWSGEFNVGVNLLQGGNDFGDTGREDLDRVGTPPVGGYPYFMENLLVGRGTEASGNIRVDFATDTDFGRFAGMGRIVAGGPGQGGGDWRRSALRFDGHVWWRPIDMLRVGLGSDLGFTGGMGETGPHRAGGAGVNIGLGGSSPAPGALDGPLGWGRAFIGDAPHGLVFELTPMDMLNVVVSLPYQVQDADAAREIGDIFRGVYARAFVDLDGIGRIGFGYAGGSQTRRRVGEAGATLRFEWTDSVTGLPQVRSFTSVDAALLWLGGAEGQASGLDIDSVIPIPASDGIRGSEVTITDPGRIHAYFRGNHLVPGLDFQFGFGVRLPVTRTYYNPDLAAGNPNRSRSWSGPTELSFGLGVQYTIMPELQIRFNASAAILTGGYRLTTPAGAGQGALPGAGDGMGTNQAASWNAAATRLAFGLAPNFQATDNVLLTLFGAFGMDIPGEDHLRGTAVNAERVNVPNRIWWAVNPYVTVNMGGPRFLAGFQIWGNNGPAHDVRAVPAPANSALQRDRDDARVNWAVPIGMTFGF